MWLLVAIKKSDERFSFHENNYSLLANKLFLNRIIREKKTPFNVFAHHFNDFIVKWKCTSMICRRCGFGWLPVRKGCRDKNQFVHICAQFSFPHIYFSLLANYFNNEEEFRICIWNCFGKKNSSISYFHIRWMCALIFIRIIGIFVITDYSSR